MAIGINGEPSTRTGIRSICAMKQAWFAQ